MSLDPLLGFQRNIHEGVEVVKTERRPIAPGTGLILEGPREGGCEERTLLTDILPDRGLNVAATQRVSGLFVDGSHLVSSFVRNEGGSLTCGGEPLHISRRKHEREAVAGMPERLKQRE